MSLYHLILLAIIQGLTEFLPISSSAHLILPAKIFGWVDQGPLIDVMAHFGTLFAVIAYFWKDVLGVLRGVIDLLHRKLNIGSMLALNLILATPPALCLALILSVTGGDMLIRSPLIIAMTTIFFGILLWVGDIKGEEIKTVDDLTWKHAIGLGLAQSLALIPGTSRSGITMTLARFMGLTRTESARFSMLMSIPIIGAGGLYSILKLAGSSHQQVTLGGGLIVAGLSFVVAYACIAVFMKWVSRIGMFPFMIYRLILGGLILVWLAGGLGS